MISITMPIGLLKDGEKCRKPTGVVFYTVARQVTIHDEKGEKKIIKSEGCSYLIGETGSINCYSNEKAVSINFQSFKHLHDYLTERINEEYSGQ